MRLLLVLASLSLAAALEAQSPASTPSAAKPAAAPDPSFAPVNDVPGLPRVLLIGDSISMGYTLPVRARLQGRANVHRPAQNCGDTGRGLQHLDAWLGEGKWDVIHFNFGLHDLKYLDAKGNYVPPEQGRQVSPLPEYEENLRALIARLKKTGAKLIFATTTPVPAGTVGRVAHDEVAYNEVARRVMKENGIAVDDLHAFVVPRQTELQRPRNVHFTADGYEALGAEVAASVSAALRSDSVRASDVVGAPFVFFRSSAPHPNPE